MAIDYNDEYLGRIYEPYVYLMTEDGMVDIEFTGGETITLFKTPEGAVKHFELMGRQPVTSVEEYYGDPNPYVHYVRVATPGKYTVVDITTNLYGKNPHTTYGRFFRNPQPHPTYGDYIGWICNESAIPPGISPAIAQHNNYYSAGSPSNSVFMKCQYCNGLTDDVDMEYLVGQDHLACVLKDNNP